MCHLKPPFERFPFPGDGGLFSCTQYINPSPSTTLFGFIKDFIKCLPGTLLSMCTRSTRVLGYQHVSVLLCLTLQLTMGKESSSSAHFLPVDSGDHRPLTGS